MKVSICIPCYEMHGRGGDFLDFSLHKIRSQTHQDFEVVISDHSQNREVENVCEKHSSAGMNIKYLRNEVDRGNSSSNINNSISNSTGDIIKILFQDDFLYHQDSVKDVVEMFSLKNAEWLVTSSCHTPDGKNFERFYFPRYTEDVMEGNNLISSPSVLSFRNTKDVWFDTNLVWLMDCDIYKRLYIRYGEPSYLNKVNVVNRTWEGQFNNHIPWERKNWEIEYGRKKYKHAL